MESNAITFGSVCSGIEAASAAWHPLGWRAAWLAEIEPFPSAVLAHRYPDVRNYGDMTKLPERIASGEVDAPDVFCGGCPCQSFSIAGLRRSLADARGNLTLTFCEIADAIDTVRSANGDDPCVVMYENVPGILSSHDNAFGCFLAGLAGEDVPLEPPRGKWSNAGVVVGPKRTLAWRVLDAQFFGLAQRRRRVFVVASARNGFDPVAVLLEPENLRRDSPPSREAGEEVAGGTGAGTSFGISPDCFDRTGEAATGTAADRSGLGVDEELAYALRAKRPGGCATPVITMAHGQGGAEIEFDTGPTLTCNHEAPIAAYCPAVSGTLLAQGNSTGGDRPPGTTVDTTDSLVVTKSIDAVCITGPITHTLKAEGFDASEDGTGRGTSLVPVAYRVHGENSTAMTGGGRARVADPVDITRALDTCGGYATNQGGNIVAQPVPGNWQGGSNQDQICSPGGVSPTLAFAGETHGGHHQPKVLVHAFDARQSDVIQYGDHTGPLDTDGHTIGVLAFQTKGSNIDVGDINGTIGTNADRASGSAPMIAFSCKDYGADAGEISPTLRSMGHDGSHANAGGQLAVAVQASQSGVRINETVGTLDANYGSRRHNGVMVPTAYTTKLHNTGSNNAGKIFEERTTCLDANSPPPALLTAMQVRRLTPRECERLQGFQFRCSPDYPGAWQDEAGRWWSPDYTEIPWRNKPASECPDGPRYKALGNSWAVDCVRWIGRRIDRELRAANDNAP